MHVSSVLAVSSLVLALAAPAAADVIDFRSGDWGPGGASSETNGDITVQAGPCAFGLCPALSWSAEDGFGVNSYVDREWDEVNNLETLRITFAGGALLSGFLVTNLFFENNQPERGFYQLNGGSFTEFSAGALPNPANGELWINFLAPVSVSSLTFSSGGGLFDWRNDFSVAAVDVVNVSAVPEPTTVMLAAFGLAAGFLRRRRLASAVLRASRL